MNIRLENDKTEWYFGLSASIVTVLGNPFRDLDENIDLMYHWHTHRNKDMCHAVCVGGREVRRRRIKLGRNGVV